MMKLFVLLILSSQPVIAQYRDNSFLFKRAQDRAATRWTLQEWLATKDRNRMMDMWLAMNTRSSPYEAMVGAAYKSTREGVGTAGEQSYTSADGYVTAHASIVGLTFEYENNVKDNFNDVNAMFNLRVFGNSIQSTYLAFHYGQRTRTFTSAIPSSSFKNQFGQVSLQLYITKYFGVDGFYRSYIPAIEGGLNQEMRGNLSEAGVFIDFKALRVFGSWYQDNEIVKDTLTPFNETTTNRVGTKAGIKLYF
jgi:hypothetical protein